MPPDFDFDSLPDAPAAPARKRGQPDPAWLSHIDARAADYPDVRPELIKGMAQVESNWDPDADAHVNFPNSHAKGLFQFQPGTAKQYGVDPSDPVSSIDGAYRYMGALLEKHGGDEEAALGDYSGHGDPAYVSKVQRAAAAWQGSPANSITDAGSSSREFDFDALPDAPPPPRSTPSSRAAAATDDGDFSDTAAFNAWRARQANLSPATASGAWDLAQKRGLDPSWVADNFDEMSKVQQEEDHAAALQQNPGLAQQFADPVKASIIKDDMASATMWERLVAGRSRLITDPNTGQQVTDYTAGGIWRAIAKGADPREPYYAAKDMLGLADKDDLAKLTALEAEPSDFGAQNKIESTLFGVAGAIPFMGEMALAGAAATLAAPVEGAAAFVGGAVAATAGALTFAQSVGPTYRRIKQAAPNVDDHTAIGLSVGASSIGAGLAAFLGPQAFEAVPVLGKFLSSTAKEAIPRVLADRTIGEAIVSAGKAYGGHWLAGVGMMTGQAAANSLAAQLARRSEGDVFDGQQVVQDAWSAAKDAASVMAVLGAWGPAKEFVADRGRLARVNEDAMRFDGLAGSVNDAPGVPDSQKERIISELRQSGVPAPDSPDDGKTVYVSRAKFDEIAKNEKVDPSQLAAKILDDNGTAYQLAVNGGTSLPVPIEKYAARMVRSGLHDQLRDDVKFSPDGFTNREAKAHQALLAVYAARSAPEAAEVAAVRERELHKALAAGIPIGQAQQHANLMQAIVLTHASRTALSPEAAYAALNPAEIFGPNRAQEPLENIPAPLPPPGAAPTPRVEDFTKTLEREKVQPKRQNPFMPISEKPIDLGQNPLKENLEQRKKGGAFGAEPKPLALETPAEMDAREQSDREFVRTGKDAKSHVPGDELEPGSTLTPNEVKALEKAIADGHGGGRETAIVTPQKPAGEPARYRVVEADHLVQSHNPLTFGVNPEYPEGVQERDYRGAEGEQGKVAVGAGALNHDLLMSDTPSAVDGPPLVTEGDRPVVLGGNGRTMMMKRAFESEQARDAYKAELQKRAARFGIDPADVEKMKSPILVREAKGIDAKSDVADLRSAGRRFNEGLTQQLSPRARGIAEAKSMTPETMTSLGNLLTANGDMSLREIMRERPKDVLDVLRRDGIVNAQNAAQWIHGGELAPEAKDRLETMFLGRLMDNEQRFNATAPAMLAKLERLAPALLRVDGMNPALSETARIRAAVDLMNSAKAQGHTIDQAVAQADMFTKPTAATISMAHILEGRKSRDLQAAFGEWARRAAVDPRQATMFDKPPTLEEARAMLRQPSIDLDGSVQRLQQPQVARPIGAGELEQAAREKGIEVSIQETARAVNLGKIVVPKESRGAGLGSDWMKKLVAAADAAGKRVTLDPATDFGGTSRARLVDFYKRFGFVENKGRNRNFEISADMYREPQQRSDPAERSAGTKWGDVAPGVHSRNLGSIADREVPVVSVTSDELRNPSPKDSRKWGEANLAGRPLGNDHTGWKATIDDEGVGHALYGKGRRPENRLLIQKLSELFKNAVLADSAKHDNPSEGRAFHRFFAPVTVDGVLRRAEIQVVERHDGAQRVYHMQSVKLERPASESASEVGSGGLAITGPSRPPGAVKIGDLLADVKRRVDGKSVLESHAAVLKQPAFHGTGAPELKGNRFSMDYIGTGEGAQVYGHGLYFAKNPAVGDWYREKLSRGAPELFRDAFSGEQIGADKAREMFFEPGRMFVNRYGDTEKVLAYRKTETGAGWQVEVQTVNKDGSSKGERTRLHWTEPDAGEMRRFMESQGHYPEDAGRLYQVDVPESDRLLDYDKPMAEQSQQTKDAVGKVVLGLAADHPAIRDAFQIFSRADMQNPDAMRWGFDRLSGGRLYKLLAGVLGAKGASETLRDAGIPGLQYLDAGSRQHSADGSATHNFVIWDENEIRDLQRLKQESPEDAQERGHIAILHSADGTKKYEIHLGPGADASTLAHETMHWLVDTLGDAAKMPGADAELVRDHAALLKWAGYEGDRDSKNLNEAAEEKIAHAWELYLSEGKSPTKDLESVFGRFARWMVKVYSGVKGGVAGLFEQKYKQPLDLNEEVRGIFDRLLAANDDIEQDRMAKEAAAAGGGGKGGGGGDEPPQAPPGGAPKRKPVPEVSRRVARGLLNSQPLNAISERFYKDAERKSTRAAIDLAAEGKLDESRAADMKRSYAAALTDAAKEITEKAQAQLARIKQIATPDGLTKIAKSAANDAGNEYLDVAQSLLETIGARPKGDPDAAAQRLGIAELLQRLDFDGRDANFDAEHLRALLAKPKAWSALTPLEAQNVHDALVQIRTAANGASKVMVGTIREERKAVIAQIGLESANRPDQGLQPVTRSADEGIVSKVLKATGLYNADNLKPEEIWKRLGNEAWKLWETTIGARNGAAKMKGEVLRNFLEKFEPVLTNGKFGDMLRQQLSPETMKELFSGGNGVQLDQSKANVETLFMAFLNLGTKSSEERLLGGYKWEKGAVLRAIGRDVPKPLLDMGQEILRYSEEKMWPLIAAHARELNGVEPPKLEKQPIIIRHADGSASAYDGGYFAAKYNSDASNFARQRVTADSVESLDRGARATVAASFTKARAARYSDVIDLNWSNYPNHINSVLHYLAYDEPVRSIGAVLRDKEFREIATRRIGIEQLQQLDDSIKAIAKGHASDAAAASSFTGKLISGVLRSRGISNAIGFSFGVAAQQIPSHMEYAVTAGKISAKNGNFALGRAVMPDNWKQALAKSSELQYRADHYSERFREALSGHVDITNGWKQKADVASFAMMDGADRVLSHVLWDAAYRDALEGRKLPDGTIAGNDEAAIEHADRTLRELMPTHNKFEMAKSVRDPGALGALQLFRGLKNVVWNVESGLFDKAKVEAQGSPLVAAAGRYGLAAARILGSAAVLHMLGKFWGGHGKNDDDGEGLQGWATWAERTAGASLVSLNAPWGGEIAEGIADHLAHGESLSDSLKKGALELRPAPALATLQDTIKRLGKMVDNDEETPARIGAFTQLILGNLGGYANQAGKTGGYLHDVATGDQRVRGPGDFLGGALYGSPGQKSTKNPFTAAQDAVSGE